MINSTTMWASQLAALNAQTAQTAQSAQSATQPNAVTGAAGSSANSASAAGSSANSLFSELISALTAGAVTVNGSGAASATSSAGATTASTGANSAAAGTTSGSAGATSLRHALSHVSASAAANVATLQGSLNKLMTGLSGTNASSIGNGLHVLA